MHPSKDATPAPDYEFFAAIEGDIWWTEDDKYDMTGYQLGFGLKYTLQKPSRDNERFTLYSNGKEIEYHGTKPGSTRTRSV